MHHLCFALAADSYFSAFLYVMCPTIVKCVLCKKHSSANIAKEKNRQTFDWKAIKSIVATSNVSRPDKAALQRKKMTEADLSRHHQCAQYFLCEIVSAGAAFTKSQDICVLGGKYPRIAVLIIFSSVRLIGGFYRRLSLFFEKFINYIFQHSAQLFYVVNLAWILTLQVVNLFFKKYLILVLQMNSKY